MNTRRLPRTASLALLTVVSALAIAACGGSNKPPASSSGSASKIPAHALRADAYKNAACMRSHGVSNFPDPTMNPHGFTIHITPAISGSPAFKSATTACAHFLPGSTGNLQIGESAAQIKAHKDALLAFAKCMRQHGFARFPDPDNQGHLTPTMIQQAGINLQEPAVRPAAYACVPLTHGIITKADVNQAIANPNGGGSQSESVQSSSASPGGGG